MHHHQVAFVASAYRQLKLREKEVVVIIVFEL
jgi:hypothetical protein